MAGDSRFSGNIFGHNLNVADINFCLFRHQLRGRVVPDVLDIDIDLGSWCQHKSRQGAAIAAPRLRAMNASKSNGIDGPEASPCASAARRAASCVSCVFQQPKTCAHDIAGIAVAALRDMSLDESSEMAV